MSIAELTLARKPRRTGRSIARQVNATRNATRKSFLRTYRKTRSAVRSWHRSQYYLWTAEQDVRRAVSRNEDIFLAAMLLIAITLFAFASTSSQLGLFLYMNVYLLSDQIGLSLVPILIMFSASLGVLALWVTAWMANLASIAVTDGAYRRKLTSLRYTVRRSLMTASRTAASWLLYLIVVFGPIAIVAGWALIYIVFGTDHSDTPILRTTVLALTVGVAWLLYALTSYGLVPHIALYEPELPLHKTLRRSHQLVQRRGRPFIFSLYLLSGLVIGAGYLASQALDGVMSGNGSLIFYASIAAMALFMRLGMVALYRKRKLARS